MMAAEPISVLWDGEVAIAVDKPAGLATQAPPGIDSLESRLRDQLGQRCRYLACPHRLDRPVSGIVLVALTKKAARLLSEQFASRKVEKVYTAEVSGQVDFPFVGEADAHDQRHLSWIDWVRKVPDRAKSERCAEGDTAAKLAETNVRWIGPGGDPGTTRLALRPVTGRMHQLRLQAAERGHPIVGDTLYGGEGRDAKQIRLHATELSFREPRRGVRQVVTCSPSW